VRLKFLNREINLREDFKEDELEFVSGIEQLLPKISEILIEINDPKKKIKNTQVNVEDLVKRVLDM
jgi:peptidoglycan hydrolase CwlO-like protein